MRTANLAIVFTDIKGFTERTSRQTLEQNEQLLKTHNDLLAPIFRAFGGRIIKMIGDAFLVTFESPTQAVLSGMAIQDRLWEHNGQVKLTEERLDVRVAINVGEVRVEANDVFGEPVNIAARVEGIADAGEVFFTEAVYLSMNKAEVPSEEVGSFELKGIPGRIKIFRVPRAPHRLEAAGAAAEAGPPYGNLGLARMPSGRAMSSAELAVTASALGQRAAALTSSAANYGGQMIEKFSGAINEAKGGKPFPVTPRRLGVLAACVMALLVGVGVLGTSKVERAINSAARASGAERDAKLNEVHQLIGAVKDPSEAAYYRGRLDEALGSPGRAISDYRNAAAKGYSDAEDRLIDLLSHEDCRVRSSAANALGDIRSKSARGELEDLAEDGGPGEDDTPLLGCSSKKAAASALRRLE